MKYNNTRRGVFVSRPNRFEAIVELDGEMVLCHVKNTGRC
ncbi:MAG: DNA/RNA nuclease SfsA, partial [Clostridia bacterium]|nr:DNA/RNA nuclease SfsA [Clostridia bacterium]